MRCVAEAIRPLITARAVARKPTVRAALKEYRSPTARDTDLDWRINERAAWKRLLDAAAVDGLVGVVVSGRDCDCTRYRHEYVMPVPAGIFGWVRGQHKHEEWLDGPESTWFVRPDECRDGYSASRDLALEAHEDGHAHVIYDTGVL